jgi:P pilus assembly chaperone PapD
MTSQPQGTVITFNRKVLGVIIVIIAVSLVSAIVYFQFFYTPLVFDGPIKTEQLKITSMTFGGTSGVANNTIVLQIRNPSPSSVTVSEVRVNDVAKNVTGTTVYPSGASGSIVISMGTGSWSTSNKYKVTLLSATGKTAAVCETTA